MTKTEMINRMIILGCIREIDRKYFRKYTIIQVMEIYLEVVPKRLEAMERR